VILVYDHDHDHDGGGDNDDDDNDGRVYVLRVVDFHFSERERGMREDLADGANSATK
jgi:hypothetical protein